MSKTARPALPPIPVRDGWVVVNDLADAIGLDRGNIRKYLNRLGVTLERRRTAESRGQLVSVICRADAEKFLSDRRSESIDPGSKISYLDSSPT